MSARNTTVNLDLSKQGCIPSLTISQYDVGVALNFLVMDGNAAFAGFESTDVIKLKGTRPSGTGFQIEASNYSSNWVSFHSTMELTAESGSTTCEIEITRSETEILHTANFYIEIEAAAHPDGTIDQDIEQFNQIAQRVGAYATTALMRAEDALAAKNAAQQSESKAEEYMNAAMEASKSAAASKEDIHEYIDDSEAWARGTRDGVDVQSTDETYHNNAKYYAERSSQNAEAWARGTRGGTAVPSTDPTYQNNAKYYAEQSSEASMAAGSSATEAAASAQKAAATLAGAIKPATIDAEFSTSTAYAVGDTVVHEGRLYEFTSAHAAGAWNASHVQAISVMDEISDIKGDLSDVVDEAVRYGVMQDKTTSEKAIARYNVGLLEILANNTSATNLKLLRIMTVVEKLVRLLANNVYLTESVGGLFKGVGDVFNLIENVYDKKSGVGYTFPESELSPDYGLFEVGSLTNAKRGTTLALEAETGVHAIKMNGSDTDVYPMLIPKGATLLYSNNAINLGLCYTLQVVKWNSSINNYVRVAGTGFHFSDISLVNPYVFDLTPYNDGTYYFVNGIATSNAEERIPYMNETYAKTGETTRAVMTNQNVPTDALRKFNITIV